MEYLIRGDSGHISEASGKKVRQNFSENIKGYTTPM
jgi:hypothetical protein